MVEIETSPLYAGDPVTISSIQLQIACGGTITFENLQGGTTRAPHQGTNSITAFLDDDGNVTVIVEGQSCAPGTDLIEADLVDAPYLTATTTLTVLPPQVTTAGVIPYPSTEVETGDTATSGISDVYTVFYVETNPVYAEQPVFLSAPELESRCQGGWRFEPNAGDPINQASGTAMAKSILDNDGNAEFVFKGAACAPGTSTVVADIASGTHTTYDTTFTIDAPRVTLGTPPVSTTTTTKKGKKPARRPAPHAGDRWPAGRHFAHDRGGQPQSHRRDHRGHRDRRPSGHPQHRRSPTPTAVRRDRRRSPVRPSAPKTRSTPSR